MANAGRLDVSREVVGFFTGHSLPGDEFAIATFAGGEVGVEVPFTSDLSVLREASQAWTAWGTTALHDAVAWIPEISINGKNPKRFALLITDGVDNASQIYPGAGPGDRAESQLPIYVLGLGSGSPFELTQGGRKGLPLRGRPLAPRLGHGRTLLLHLRPEDLKKALDVILEDLRHQYVLGFATGDGPSRFRQVKVEVKEERTAAPSCSGAATREPRPRHLRAASLQPGPLPLGGRPLSKGEPTMKANRRCCVRIDRCPRRDHRLRDQEIRPSGDRGGRHAGRRGAGPGRGGPDPPRHPRPQIGETSQTAQEALQRAQEAGKLAQGKFLYETVLSDDKVKFGFDTSDLSPEAEAALDEFASQLTERKQERLHRDPGPHRQRRLREVQRGARHAAG